MPTKPAKKVVKKTNTTKKTIASKPVAKKRTTRTSAVTSKQKKTKVMGLAISMKALVLTLVALVALGVVTMMVWQSTQYGDTPITYDDPSLVEEDISALEGGVPGADASSVLAASSSRVTKVLVFVEENHSVAQAKKGMPYAMSLAKKYGYATKYVGTSHPSLGNYIAIAGGDSHGIKDDKAPGSHKISGPSVFGQAIAAGKTAATYSEGMTSNCRTSNSGKYAVKHNPWAYFTAERGLCNKFNVSTSRFGSDVASGKLPNVGMVVPNQCNDAHDCGLGTADKWFKARMATIFAGPDWKSGNLAVILTFDEDDKKGSNDALTIVIHPSQNKRVVTKSLSHYSLSRMLSEVVGAQPIAKAKSAPSLSSAFGLTVK